MKNVIKILLVLGLSMGLLACGLIDSSGSTGKDRDAAGRKESETAAAETSEQIETADASESDEFSESDETEILVVYFSVTGTTKGVAEKIASVTGADMAEIVPAEPYSSDDIDYHDKASRTSKEQDEKSERPGISGTIENWDQYSVVFLGHPIWWGEEPRIMDTFVEAYDFTGKTVIPFCTSGSSGVGSSDDNLKANAGTGSWLEGTRFSGSVSETEIRNWIEAMELSPEEDSMAAKSALEENEIRVIVGKNSFVVRLEDNESAAALRELLKDGDKTIPASNYGGFEKVCRLGTTLPSNDVQTRTSAGDVMLYSSSQIVIFYDSNSWAYTRLGKVEGLTAKELEKILSGSETEITLSLN